MAHEGVEERGFSDVGAANRANSGSPSEGQSLVDTNAQTETHAGGEKRCKRGVNSSNQDQETNWKAHVAQWLCLRQSVWIQLLEIL